MKTRLVRVGNSRGLRLAKPLVEHAGFEDATTRHLPAQVEFLRRSALLVIALVAPSCASDQAAAPLALPSVTLAVVGQAAASLDSTGHFELAVAPQTSFEISEARARQIAEGWVATYASFQRGFLERQRRASIDTKSLRPCGRIFYAQSPFVVSADAAPLSTLRRYAAWWIVTLCGASGEPQVSLAVSSLLSQAQLEAGRLTLQPPHGNEFRSVGIPPGFGDLVIPPEDAVRELYALTGKAVALTPRLWIRADDTVPNLAQWELTLETAAAFEAETGNAETTTFYVSRGQHLDRPEKHQGRYLLSIPRQHEPPETTVRYPELDEAGRIIGWRSVRLARSAPATFVPATILSTPRVP
ncbi:MAG: hypothetical protein HUU26_10015 [Gemmatimonadaceae bacterium]|nr:hypothetical protein [Gemmatimonadaceae bacterium]